MHCLIVFNIYSKSTNYWLCDESATAEVYTYKSINEEYYKIVNGA